MFYGNGEFGDITFMSRPNENLFQGETVFFATKHGKEDIIAPLLATIGITCEAVKVDTDLFGTFAGGVARVGTVRETLRKKIQAAAREAPHAKLLLSSEGSFGPHPLIGLGQTDLESLLLWHRDLDVEIYAEYLCQNPVHAEKVHRPRDNFRAFLKETQFPDHGVIVHPEGMMSPIFKGLHTEWEAAQAMIDSFSASKNGLVVLATDLRADHNPTRRNAIREAGLKLVEKLQSLCPRCEFPGFSIEKSIPGLPCGTCGEPSRAARAVIWACVKCDFSEERPRPDLTRTIDSSECEFCNP